MKLKIYSEDDEINKQFKENGVELNTRGKLNEIEVYTNDWVSVYEVKLKGKMPFLRLKYGEKCYR